MSSTIKTETVPVPSWPHPMCRDGPIKSAQPPRAQECLADLNQVKGCTGIDRIGRTTAGDSPVALPAATFNGLTGLKKHYDLIIVGCGLSGCVFAERASRELGKSCLILDKRPHLGGNCYDYVDSHGIRVSQYGVHLFHTKSQRVWDYITRFSLWIPYEHRVKALLKTHTGDFKLVPVPPNQETVNTLYGANVSNEEEMLAWLNAKRPKDDGNSPKNGEESAIRRAGSQLYEDVFKYYTYKQWAKWPSQLDASVLARIPVRENRDDRYFNDPVQALPARGYTRIFENMCVVTHLCSFISLICGVHVWQDS